MIFFDTDTEFLNSKLNNIYCINLEYFQRGDYNLFFVDWSVLVPAPCYPSAARNVRHTGVCIAQLVERILDSGTDNIHLIGFSLGAQVTNFAANKLKSFKLPRITGLVLFLT